MDLNKEARIWCEKHSNDCFDTHNMESAYIAGSLNAINRIWRNSYIEPRRGRYIIVKPKDASVGEVFLAKTLTGGEYIREESIGSLQPTDIWCYLYDILPNTK